MSYCLLFTEVFHGTTVGISPSVATHLAERSSAVPSIKVGLGAAAGLIMAGPLPSQGIRRTGLALERDATSGTYSHLSQASSDDVGAVKRAQTVAGASPLVGIGVVLLPFTFHGALITQQAAVVASVILDILLLPGFGTWLGVQTIGKDTLSGYELLASGSSLRH